MPAKTNPRTASATPYVVTAWAGKGCLYMAELNRAGVSARIRQSMKDARCTRITVRRGSGDVFLTLQTGLEGSDGYRGPDGKVHAWVCSGTGRVEGVPHDSEIFGKDGQFAEGWDYANAEFAAAEAKKKAETIEKLRQTAEGRELLAKWGVEAA